MLEPCLLQLCFHVAGKRPQGKVPVSEKKHSSGDEDPWDD